MPKPKELVRLEPENENALWSDALILYSIHLQFAGYIIV